MSYKIIAEQRREEIIFYETYGSYQWERIMATEKNWIFRIYKDYYGSCSWCDHYESKFAWENPQIDSEKVIEFVSQYEPFMERKVEELTKQDIKDGVILSCKNSRNFKKEHQEELVKQLCEHYYIK